MKTAYPCPEKRKGVAMGMFIGLSLAPFPGTLRRAVFRGVRTRASVF